MRNIVRSAIMSGVIMAVQFVSTTAHAQIAISPWFFGGGSYGGGTADGNFMFGLGQVIRAEGDYNLSTSQAAINFEVARSKYLENSSRWIQGYYRGREANQAYQLQKIERNRHSPETLAQAAAAELPRKLTSDDIDPTTGKIHWPEQLLGDEYAVFRSDLEEVFEIRGWTSRSPDTTARIHGDTHAMIEILRSHIDELNANDFMAARKFLDALDYSVVTPGRRAPAPAAVVSSGD
jgi:hypothetical protein